MSVRSDVKSECFEKDNSEDKTGKNVLKDCFMKDIQQIGLQEDYDRHDVKKITENEVNDIESKYGEKKAEVENGVSKVFKINQPPVSDNTEKKVSMITGHRMPKVSILSF